MRYILSVPVHGLSCGAVHKLFCPHFQLLRHLLLLVRQNRLHRQRVLLQAVDERDRELLVDHLLRRDYDQSGNNRHRMTGKIYVLPKKTQKQISKQDVTRHNCQLT